eukprot:g159.t1
MNEPESQHNNNTLDLSNEKTPGSKSHISPAMFLRVRGPASSVPEQGTNAQDSPDIALYQARQTIVSELSISLTCLSNRGLTLSSKWAAELLVSLTDGSSSSTSVTTSAHSNLAQAETPCLQHLRKLSKEDKYGTQHPLYQLGKTYFDLKEYQRAAHTFAQLTTQRPRANGANENVVSDHQQPVSSMSSEQKKSSSEWRPHPLHLFMKCYSLYLAGEQLKEQERLEMTDSQTLQRTEVPNKNLSAIEQELRKYVLQSPTTTSKKKQMASNGMMSEKLSSKSNKYNKGIAESLIFSDLVASPDPFLLYLLGVVVKAQYSDKSDAIFAFSQSTRIFPWNWSAWLDLNDLVRDKAHLREITLNINPPHLARDFFVANALLQLHHNEDCLEMYNRLTENIIPEKTSTFVIVQQALAYYNLLDYETSQSLFEELIAIDPYRLENMDAYSNILYVNNERAKLSFLAHSATKTDKFRAETCCIVGNFYSQRAEHEKAIIYFQRALQLNDRFLSAWTLMGHEFVELKNTAAAIEAYRRAVDVNDRDFRAWYGLGQTYEILGKYAYAMFYFKKACLLRPYDARMWCALGGCYEKL